jgi:hypothetical protein
MRTVRLRGGLGNQLFGLAFAHSVRRLTDTPVALDVGGFARDRYRRAFVTGDLAAALDLEVVSRGPIGAVLSRAPWPGHVREGPAPADLARFARHGRCFDGYWQDECYMAAPQTIRIRTRAFLDSRAAPPEAHDIVVHHRAYREEPIAARRRGPAADYVDRAIDLIAQRQGRTRDIVRISDDGADPFVDMAVLLKARALILANSSFSWWAGYCGDATLVTYPARNGAFHYPAPARSFVVL